MKSIILFSLIVLLAICGVTTAKAKELNGQEILSNIENANESKDRTSSLKMILIDDRGKENLREIKFWTKGKNRRLIKFLSPADVKGVGYLVLDADLPSEKMCLYLPAFNKVRRIAGSGKSGSFMGTDFSYSDISSTLYAEDYDAKRLPDQNDQYVLELKRKAGSNKDYARLTIWADRNFVPIKIEFYTQENAPNPQKIMIVEKIEKSGKYWISKKITMEDLRKKHKTVLELSDITFDSGLPDSLFTERNLQK